MSGWRAGTTGGRAGFGDGTRASLAKQAKLADLHADGAQIRAARDRDRRLPGAIDLEIDALEPRRRTGVWQPDVDDCPGVAHHSPALVDAGGHDLDTHRPDGPAVRRQA